MTRKGLKKIVYLYIFLKQNDGSRYEITVIIWCDHAKDRLNQI